MPTPAGRVSRPMSPMRPSNPTGSSPRLLFSTTSSSISASGVVLADGTTLPAAVGNGTDFAGYPMTDLKTAVETAGDLTQMEVQIDLVGTVFGVAPPAVPLPSSINLANDGFICQKPAGQGKNVSNVCCTKDPKFKTNITTDDEFLPRQNGDLSIMYDVLELMIPITGLRLPLQTTVASPSA